MFIAHVRFPIAPEHRPIATKALVAGLEEVRAMKGCIAFYPIHDPTDDAALGVIHEWESEDDFAAYTASDAFRTFGATIRPLMTGKPVSRRFRSEFVESAN